ncbi:hypothetical protein EYF80_005895 [Liparis tanakae]|uniref:Uncharacterized protein n=1 Tax=Liparis tanakae TaxID=230148 RepID=A0A4Z2J2F3_9TELE|nr:hypothetical protein EYF80_005895 [Liparis tanakae]
MEPKCLVCFGDAWTAGSPLSSPAGDDEDEVFWSCIFAGGFHKDNDSFFQGWCCFLCSCFPLTFLFGVTDNRFIFFRCTWFFSRSRIPFWDCRVERKLVPLGLTPLVFLEK